MKFLILFSIIFTLSFVAINQEAFAILGCDDPHCYSLMQSDNSSPVDGLEYSLDSPDIWVDPNTCNNIAVSTGWLIAPKVGTNEMREWVESGVTKGYFTNNGCVTALSTYYAYNTHINNAGIYTEILVPNGRVDPGDDITVKLQRNPINTNQIQVYVTAPDLTSTFPKAQLGGFHPDNVYFADYGIEGTISASDEYSSIPMSKFTNMKIKQNGSWISLPSSASVTTLYTSDGYLGKKCSTTSFIAGSLMSLDCNNIAVNNQVPTLSTLIFNPVSNAPITIDLSALDTDKDYLTYFLTELPTKGFLNYNNKLQKIPNIDGDSSEIKYTPASSTPESDFVKYTVSDGRTGHTREGTISIIGPFTPSVPHSIDDFNFSTSGTTITFSWTHPDDGGDAITWYSMERSTDTATWSFHNSFDETTTGYVYDRSPGYDGYFRVIAHNGIGESISNVVHVHITDTIPPTVTLSLPLNGETVTTFAILTKGTIDENNDFIKDVQILVDDVLSTDEMTITYLGGGGFANVNSILRDIQNGAHTITLRGSNVDDYYGEDSVDITLAAHIPSTLDFFFEDFQTDMFLWEVTTQEDNSWEVLAPTVSDQNNPDNKVSGTYDCDQWCSMIMLDDVDLTQMVEPTLTFDRFVATGADPISSTKSFSDGILVYISIDDGTSWTLLDSFTADDCDLITNICADDGNWHFEEYDLSSYSSSKIKLKFDAWSESLSEDTEVDNIKIYDAAIVEDTEAPSFTSIPTNKIFEANSKFTDLSTLLLGTPVVEDNIDSSPSITNNATGIVELNGVKIDRVIEWNATDASGNSAYEYQTITIEDTTIPTITVPSPYVIDVYANSVPIALDESDFGTATATDIFTPVVITNNATDYLFPEGDTTIKWIATDINGNVASGMQKITVNQLELFYESYTFDSETLEGWTPNFNVGTFAPVPNWPFHEYVLNVNTVFGNPVPALFISGDGFVSNTYAKKTFDISNSTNIHLSFDYRAISTYAGSCVTNARVQIADELTSTILYSETLVCGGTKDTGTQNYYKDLTDIVKDYDSIIVSGLLNDSWIANWSQKLMFDNITVSEKAPTLSFGLLSSSNGFNNSFNTFVQPESAPSQINGTDSEQDPIDEPPVMNIKKPSDGAIIEKGSKFEFTIKIVDDIDNKKIGKNVHWYSSIDGFLGDHKFIKNPKLSVGEHIIIANVTDSGGNYVEDSINITIVPPFDGKK